MDLPVPDVRQGDWNSVRIAIQKIKTLLGTNRILTDVVDLTGWITGTTNQITVTDNTDGTITLSTPQNIHTDATPEFAGTVIKDSSDNIIFYVDDDELYFTAAPAVGLTGQPIGLLLVLTYAS